MEVVLSVLAGCLIGISVSGLLTAVQKGCDKRQASSGSAQVRRCAACVGKFLLSMRVVAPHGAAQVQREVQGWKGVGAHMPSLKPEEALGVVCVLSALAGVLGLAVAGTPLAGIGGVVAFPIAIAVRIVGRQRRETRQLEEAMPEAFGALAISLGSGHSLPQAMRFVGNHAEEPIRSEFMRVSFALDCGVPAPAALDAMLRRLQAPGLELVVLALKVSKRTGAPLRELLGEAASLVGDRIDLRRRLDVKTSQARMSAHVVALMPVAMIVLLSLLSADFRQGLFTLTGALCVVIALVLNAMAWSIIRKIMRIDW